MRIQSDYPYKKTGLPFHSAKITLVVDEAKESTVLWSKNPESYGKAFRKENEDYALSKIPKEMHGILTIEIDELRYEEPYDQQLMNLVVDRSIHRGLEMMRSQPGSSHNVGKRPPLS